MLIASLLNINVVTSEQNVPNPVFCAKSHILCKHPWSSLWRSRQISTKFSGELPRGWGTFWHRPYSDSIHMWGAVYQRVKCAKSCFWANTPIVALEGFGQLPRKFGGDEPYPSRATLGVFTQNMGFGTKNGIWHILLTGDHSNIQQWGYQYLPPYLNYRCLHLNVGKFNVSN